MLKKKQRLFKRARSTNSWSGYREYQKDCRRELRRAEWQFINGKILQGLEQKDNKPFWRYIKARKQDNTSVAPLKDKGQLHTDSQTKANILLSHFKSVFTKASPTPPPQLPPPHFKINPITISAPGVTKFLKDLNPYKASGPDDIPSQVLKTPANQIGPSLTIIFQVSLDSGKLPMDWLSANVSCAFKKSDRHLAFNYRPISLTSVSCEILEHIVCRHILSHLESNNILTYLNHSFCSGNSTETQLLTSTQDLLSSFDQNKQIDMAILDFSEAFDTVPHHRLLLKLSSYGICDSLHDWLRCFLRERNMQVVVESVSSKPDTYVDSGVPQGTVLGPLLLLCHINDLKEMVSSQVRLFAYDCLIYREINEYKDHYTLQQDLKHLEDWAERWGMRFNATKCYVMSIAQRPGTTFMYQLNHTLLKSASSNPYLGILFSDRLSWNQHINISKKANIILGFIRRNLRRCPTACKKTAYLALVRPLLENGAIIWDPYQKQDIGKMERIQRNAVRFITRVCKSKTPGSVTHLQIKHDLPTLPERREDLRLTFLHKMVEGLVPAIPPDKYLTPRKPAEISVLPTTLTTLSKTRSINNSATTTAALQSQAVTMNSINNLSFHGL